MMGIEKVPGQQRRYALSRSANSILSWSIGAFLVALPIMAYFGSSARLIEMHLVVLAVLVVMRQPAVQRFMRKLAALASGIRWSWFADNAALRAAWFPCLCIFLVTLVPNVPAWLGQASFAVLFPMMLVINYRVRTVVMRMLAVFLSILFLLPVLWIFYFDAVVAPIGVDSVEALLQTDLMEAWQFVAANTDERFSRLVWLIAGCSILAALRQTPTLSPAIRGGGSFSEAQLWMLVSAALLIVSSAELSLRVAGVSTSLHESVENFREQEALFSQSQEPFSNPGMPVVLGQAPDIIVYIGESTTSRHMGIYGYPRDTTPYLASLGENLIRFDDVVAPHTHTAQALREMLTDWNFDGVALMRTTKDPKRPSLQPYNILDVLNASGMKTWWFSNHNQYGIWDNPVTNIAKRASETKFFRKSVGKNFSAAYFDDYMVREAAALIESGAGNARRAIFIHSYAGHSDYCKNIPDNWRGKFSASWSKEAYFGDFPGDMARVDCYDSAISYVDDNLRTVIEAARRQTRPTVVVYVADHGEDVDDGSGHNSELHTFQHIAVPLTVFFNDAARAALPGYWPNLAANRGLPFEAADLYHLLADLARIDFPHVDKTRAPSSDSYRPRPRHILPRGKHWLALDAEPSPGMRDLRDSIVLAQSKLRRLSEADRRKLCVHHANTLAKLREATFLLSCVEFDAVFDQAASRFHVYHPPDPDPGLDLETYLQWAGGARLWLDWKNLNEDNLEQAFAALADHDRKHRLKERLVIEIGADFLDTKVSVERFRQLSAGWRLSLYLPTDRGLHCRDPSLTTSAECADLERRILETVRRFGFSHVSFDAELFPWIRDSPQLSSLSVLTWKFSEIIQHSDMGFVAEELFRKSEIFLVPMQSKYSSGQFDCCAHPAYQ